MTDFLLDNIILRDKGAPNIDEIIDIAELTELFQNYSHITGMTTALLDLDGNVLIATNWQDSCTQFHRVSEVTQPRCLESDTALAGSLQKGEKYNVYRCRNGLVDVATPVIVDGDHVANFFIGQFFFEKPDIDYFERQAEEAGFDKAAYLDAISRVPIHNEATIKSHMSLLVRIAEMIGKAGAANLRASEANAELKKHKDQLQKLVDKRTEKLKQSLEAAEAANLAKSKFLSNMSHELRTPLNAILGFSQILVSKEQNPAKKRYLESINIAGKGLLNLINSVLDLSRIEVGKMPVQEQPMSLSSLLEEINVIFRVQADEKDLDLLVTVSENTPKSILFDETKLRQMLINLVGNAIKFTKQGVIKCQVQAKSISNDRFTLEISVQDTGIGIGLEDQKRIFESFEQANDQSINEYGGTGLGLALTKQLSNLLGGDLTADSAVGKGSTFTVRVPDVKIMPDTALTSEQWKYHQDKEIRFSPATILVVDDSEVNRDLMVSYLSDWEFNVLLAGDGAQAVKLAQENCPDLIFMDIKMPVMNGFEAIEKIRSDVSTKSIPIVAATASALKNEREEIRSVCDGYLRKPISIEDLLGCLKQFIPEAKPVESSPITKKVLIVDDDSINCFILSDILKSFGFSNVDSVSSGVDAIELCCGSDRPEIILLDYQMPGVNGVDAAREIRDWEKSTASWPSKMYLITACSAEEMGFIKDEALFDDVLKKPFEVDQISVAFNEYLS